MATHSFICDVEDSEGSVGSLQLKQRVCSYTLIRVLLGVLVVLILVITGGITWVMLSQNCTERIWSVTVSDKRVLFTANAREKYEFSGKILTKETSSRCKNTFRLLLNDTQEILKHNVSQQFHLTVDLEKGSKLKIEMNCEDVEIDEVNSNLSINQTICGP